jgi:hypothetical protein
VPRLALIKPALRRSIRRPDFINSNQPLLKTKMKLNIKNLPLAAEALRCARLAAVRFALHEAGTLLRAGAPHIAQAGEKLQSLSQHPALIAPPPSFDLK